MIDRQKIVVLCIIFESTFTVLKDESITSIILRQKALLEVYHSFAEMLDYGICSVTYRLDKIEILFELAIATTQIFVNFS